jgi:hypothetical protein
MHGTTNLKFSNIVLLEIRAVYEIMCEHIVEPDTPQMTIRHTRVAFWIPKATDTHPEYVIILAFSCQLLLSERSPMLRYPYLDSLVTS